MPTDNQTQRDKSGTAAPASAKGGKSVPDTQPMPDHAETDREKQERETERGLERALNRIPPD